MPQLSAVLAGILRDVTTARVKADTTSAELVEYYRKDPVLQCFPVPRVEIKELTIHLRFAFAPGEKTEDGSEIIVDAKSLQELRDQVISTLDITTGICNYDLLVSDDNSGAGKLLVERDQ
jgi:hypothetical protein